MVEQEMYIFVIIWKNISKHEPLGLIYLTLTTPQLITIEGPGPFLKLFLKLVFHSGWIGLY